MRELNPGEFRELKTWQRRMVTVFVLTMAGLFGVAAVDLAFGLSERAAWLCFLLLIGLVVPGGFVQFSQRCPGCGYRLGLQSRLLVPEHCRKCGITLKQRARDVS